MPHKAAQKRKSIEIPKKKLKVVKNNATDDSDNETLDTSSDDEMSVKISKRSSHKSPVKKSMLNTKNNLSTLRNFNKVKQKNGSTKSKLSATTIDEWSYHDPEQSVCAHNLCCKPQDENVNWAACDTCDKWFHTLCALGLNVMLDDNAEFNCGCKTGGPATTNSVASKAKRM